jgi:hypothetical protein
MELNETQAALKTAEDLLDSKKQLVRTSQVVKGQESSSA